jgi:neutral ceramidase
VKAFHFFQDMNYFTFQLPTGETKQTCPPALGYSFAAGTTDGPGPAGFYQNDPNKPNANPIWQLASAFLKEPSEKQAACQAPKPILIDAGEIDFLYQWAPQTVDVQMLRVGSFIIIVSPSEVTTMAGRRWKAAVSAAAVSQGITKSAPTVVIGSPANTYAHYVATPEEYGIQRYEGASTLYGQWQLPAYVNLTVGAIHYLSASSTTGPPQGALPPDNSKVSLDFISSVVLDAAPLGKHFGDVLVQPAAAYARGAVVNASFVGANPRNNLRLEGTFAAVEMLQAGVWTQVRDDWDWFLVMTWTRDNSVLGTSHVVVSWETEMDALPGEYRLRYYGDSKSLLGKITAFQGISNNFTLT